MSTVIFQIEDKKAEMLNEAARERGISVEELLQQIAEDFLSRKQGFEAAAKYVLRKNAELYQRLAK
jgi:antitoxin FitA